MSKEICLFLWNFKIITRIMNHSIILGQIRFPGILRNFSGTHTTYIKYKQHKEGLALLLIWQCFPCNLRCQVSLISLISLFFIRRETILWDTLGTLWKISVSSKLNSFRIWFLKSLLKKYQSCFKTTLPDKYRKLNSCFFKKDLSFFNREDWVCLSKQRPGKRQYENYFCQNTKSLFPRQIILFYYLFLKITLQYCSGFCHTLTWIIHGFTCVPHPDPPSHLPPHPIPLGLPSAPALSTCLMHPTWAGDLFHPWWYTCFNAILSGHPTIAFSHRIPKSVLYICVSFSVLHIVLSLPSF